MSFRCDRGRNFLVECTHCHFCFRGKYITLFSYADLSGLGIPPCSCFRRSGLFMYFRLLCVCFALRFRDSSSRFVCIAVSRWGIFRHILCWRISTASVCLSHCFAHVVSFFCSCDGASPPLLCIRVGGNYRASSLCIQPIVFLLSDFALSCSMISFMCLGSASFNL